MILKSNLSLWSGNISIRNSVHTPLQFEKNICIGDKNYPLIDFPPAFLEWSIKSRKENLDIFRRMIDGDRLAKPKLSGSHIGMVATYGAERNDSLFKINNAVKGFGFLPKESKIEKIIALLNAKKNAEMKEKLDLLESLYDDAVNIFDLDRMASLELYAEPEFETQTFINQMVNPECAVVFLDIPTYKIKSIVSLLDPQDSALNDYEKQLVQFVNLMHSFFHGKFPKKYITAVYFNVEIYNSSPGKKEGMGRRVDLR